VLQGAAEAHRQRRQEPLVRLAAAQEEGGARWWWGWSWSWSWCWCWCWCWCWRRGGGRHRVARPHEGAARAHRGARAQAQFDRSAAQDHHAAVRAAAPAPAAATAASAARVQVHGPGGEVPSHPALRAHEAPVDAHREVQGFPLPDDALRLDPLRAVALPPLQGPQVPGLRARAG